jgi:orotidine-5'-phosphate decarboxylase
MNHIREAGEGLIINIPRQDGRGLGLPFKLATLRIQWDLGVDTVTASALLDPDGSRDTRTYAGIVAILQFLNIPKTSTLHLESNNPEKMKVFPENGYSLSDLRPVVIHPTKYTRHHLEAKEKELGHINLIAPDLRETATRRVEWGWRDRIYAGIEAHNSHVCCGLDPVPARFPREFSTAGKDVAVLGFFKEIVRLTSQHVCAFKLQKAFFDELNSSSDVLRRVIDLVHCESPSTPVILDCKVGDIENTMNAYLRHLFVDLNADAIVINPYMGADVWQPLEQYPDRAAFVLVRTSNPGAACVQDVRLRDGKALWEHVLHLTLKEWRAGRNLMPIISSNSAIPQDLARDVEETQVPFLVAGVGAQGGRLQTIAPLLKQGAPFLVNSSRRLLYPYSPDDQDWRSAVQRAVTELRDEIAGQLT